MPTKTIVAISGGFDSTYMLWKLLSSTDDEVTAIHFDKRYVTENRKHLQGQMSVYEDIIINNIKTWLINNTRSFNYTTHAVSDYEDKQSPEMYMLKYTGTQINSGAYDRVAFGFGAKKVNGVYDLSGRPANNSTPFDFYPPYYANYASVSTLWYPLVEWEANTFKIMSDMPEALKNLISSCTNPSINDSGNIITCGECSKCMWNDFVKYKISEGSLTESTFKSYMESQSTYTYTKDGVEKTFSRSGITKAISVGWETYHKS